MLDGEVPADVVVWLVHVELPPSVDRAVPELRLRVAVDERVAGRVVSVDETFHLELLEAAVAETEELLGGLGPWAHLPAETATLLAVRTASTPVMTCEGVRIFVLLGSDPDQIACARC